MMNLQKKIVNSINLMILCRYKKLQETLCLALSFHLTVRIPLSTILGNILLFVFPKVTLVCRALHNLLPLRS